MPRARDRGGSEHEPKRSAREQWCQPAERAVQPHAQQQGGKCSRLWQSLFESEPEQQQHSREYPREEMRGVAFEKADDYAAERAAIPPTMV